MCSGEDAKKPCSRIKEIEVLAQVSSVNNATFYAEKYIRREKKHLRFERVQTIPRISNWHLLQTKVSTNQRSNDVAIETYKKRMTCPRVLLYIFQMLWFMSFDLLLLFLTRTINITISQGLLILLFYYDF